MAEDVENQKVDEDLFFSVTTDCFISEETESEAVTIDNSQLRLTNKIEKVRTENGKYINEYLLLRRLGQGSIASVKLCERAEAVLSKEQPNDFLVESEDDVKEKCMKLSTDEKLCKDDGKEEMSDDLCKGINSKLSLENADEKPSGSENVQMVKYAIKSYNKRRLARVKKYKSKPGGGMMVVTALERVQREIEILAGLGVHENICTLYEIMEDEACEKLYTILEYLDGGCLMTYDPKSLIHTNPEKGDVLDANQALQFAKDVSNGLTFLHGRGILHRDIKPENIILKSTPTGRKKGVIADFGCSVQLHGEAVNTGIIKGTEGTYAYFSPQMCEGGEYNGYLADIWALGVTMHVSVFGILPFYTKGMKQILDLIKSEDTQYCIPRETELQHSELAVMNSQNERLCSLLSDLVHRDESQRLSLEALRNTSFSN